MPEDKKKAGSKVQADQKEVDSPEKPSVKVEEGDTTGASPRLIKYMGSADVRTIARGETAGGTLPPLPFPIRFKESNHWTLDVSKMPEVADVWWDTLIESGDFLDVTDYERKPLNAHQAIFQGMKGSPVYNPALDALESAEGDAPEGSGLLTDRPTTTTVGGSTSGDAASSGSSTTTVGGSTPGV